MPQGLCICYLFLCLGYSCASQASTPYQQSPYLISTNPSNSLFSLHTLYLSLTFYPRPSIRFVNFLKAESFFVLVLQKPQCLYLTHKGSAEILKDLMKNICKRKDSDKKIFPEILSIVQDGFLSLTFKQLLHLHTFPFPHFFLETWSPHETKLVLNSVCLQVTTGGHYHVTPVLAELGKWRSDASLRQGGPISNKTKPFPKATTETMRGQSVSSPGNAE